MIDMHSHILYAIDDGARNIEESLFLINKLKELGFKKIVCTPHYIENSSYNKNNIEKLKNIKKIKSELPNDIDIELFLGNEIFINKNIEDHLKDREIASINKSKYILVELPLHNKINNIENYLYELMIQGYKVILAHPERYDFIKSNRVELNKFIENGVLFQCNYGSIIGQYGYKSKKVIKYMLKNGMVSFLGTDIHRMDSNLLLKLDKAIKKIKRVIGNEEFYKISCENPERVLQDKEIF